MDLSFERIEGEDARADALFLHGILGRGANLRTIAKRFVAACPGYSAVLVDLRGHGGSKAVPAEPATLSACADDVIALTEKSTLPTRVVFGHSFGGKVALELASRHGFAAEAYVIVDSLPGPRTEARGSEATLEVIELLGRLPGPFATRQAFVAALIEGGQPKGIAEWLATSLRKDDDGFRFGIELSLVHDLLADYFRRDLWPAVEGASAKIHLVVGERSTVYDAAALDRARALTGGGRVTLDLVPAGHWVHVDAPDALLDVLVTRIGAAR